MVEYSYFEVRGLFHFRKKSIYKRGLFTHFGSSLAIKSASQKSAKVLNILDNTKPMGYGARKKLMKTKIWFSKI